MLKIGPEYNEQRQFIRMPINAEITFSINGQNTPYTGYCKNLSHSGINFVTDLSLKAGQSLQITIDTGVSKFDPMKAVAEVVRIEPYNDQYSIGCKILKYE